MSVRKKRKAARIAAPLSLALLPLVGCSAMLPVNNCNGGDLTQVQPASVTLSSKTSFSPEQRQYAQIEAGIAVAKGLPARIQLLAVATSVQETDLHNFPGGDGSSVGLYQQTDIYGPATQRVNPVWATNAFLFGTRRAMEIHRPDCASVSRDEATLVALCGLAQGDFDGPLLASLDIMMAPTASRVAAVRLKTFAVALASAGLRLAPPAGAAGARLN